MGYPKLGIIIASFWFAAKHYKQELIHTNKLRNTYQPYSKAVKLFSFCPKCVQFKKKMDSKDKAFLLFFFTLYTIICLNGNQRRALPLLLYFLDLQI